MNEERESVPEVVGRRIRKRLLENGQSVKQWADLLQKTPQNCYQILSGRQGMSMKDIYLSARFLGISSDELLNPEEELSFDVTVRPEDSPEDITRRVMDRLRTYLQAREAKQRKEGD
jgi:transcriptional regulator with XRE-family HTH domain